MDFSLSLKSGLFIGLFERRRGGLNNPFGHTHTHIEVDAGAMVALRLLYADGLSSSHIRAERTPHSFHSLLYFISLSFSPLFSPLYSS